MYLDNGAGVWGTVPQWLQFVATAAALWWAVYLYRRSLREKRSAEAKLVYAVPKPSLSERLPNATPFQLGHIDRINVDEYDALSRLPDREEHWITTEDSLMVVVNLHNDSKEVMNAVSVHVWAASGRVKGTDIPRRTSRGRSDVVPYLVPGEKVRMGIVMELELIDVDEIELRTFVKFSDFNGRRWRRDVLGPLYWSSEHASKFRLFRPTLWVVDDDDEYWYKAKI